MVEKTDLELNCISEVSEFHEEEKVQHAKKDYNQVLNQNSEIEYGPPKLKKHFLTTKKQ